MFDIAGPELYTGGFVSIMLIEIEGEKMLCFFHRLLKSLADILLLFDL